MNLVILSGNIGKEPTEITGGIKFSIATNDYNGEEKFTLWTEILFFGKKAENLKQYLTPGRLVLVKGTLREQKDLEGKHRKSNVMALDVELLGSNLKDN